MISKDTIYIVVLLLCLACCYPVAKKIYLHYRRKIKYAKIQKELNLLFQDLNPYQVSMAARLKMPNNCGDLTYGEIDTLALLDLLAIIKPPAKCVFYDLGSGCGKSALAVKLHYPHMKVHGIEVIPELHEIATQKLQLYLTKRALKAEKFTLSFFCQNLLDHNFSHADIIFINATAFSPDIWEQILYKLVQLKRGAKIIITTKGLPTPTFVEIYSGMELMSWGLASTYIYEKFI
jgi:precorrin-6B methylase 2